MDISEFILKGQIENLKVGANISNYKVKLEEVTCEEGDIPSLYELGDFQITCLKNIVIGILYDFEYDTEKKYNLKLASKNFKVGFNTKLNDVETFLKEVSLKYELLNSQNDDYKEILLLESKILLRFVNSDYTNLCKAYIFDFELYERIKKNNQS